jgi:hypothetical protein
VFADKQTSNEIVNLIKEKKLDSFANREIIDNSNWKFKDGKKNNQRFNRYSWTELYEIARIPSRYSQMFQNYFSSFVHGLGLSLNIEDDDDNLTFTILSLDLSTVLMSMILKILLQEYEDETKSLVLHEKTLKLIDDNWNNWK